MNDPSLLSPDERVWLGLVVFQILSLYLWSWSQPNRNLAWFQPPVMLSVIFLYYTVAGPLHALREGKWIDRGVNLRDGMGVAWQGAAIAFLAFLVGYSFIRQQLPPPRRSTGFDSSQAWRLGRTLNALGITLFGLITGPRLLTLLNPITARQAEAVGRGLDFGPFANYAGLAVNFLIPGTLLLTAVWVSQRRGGSELLVWLMVASGIFTTLGFRYRLALLFSGVLLVFFLARGRQPSAVVVIPSVIGLLGLAGLIGLTRDYGQGLDLSRTEGLGFWDLVLAGFGESGIFLTSGGVMSLTPSEIQFVGVTPLVNTLLFPIPSQLLPGKDSVAYLANATAVVYNSSIHNSGSAFLNYAEYFLMGGWPVLIVGYLLLGWLCRRLWLWFRWRRHEPIAQVAYVCAVTYLYVVVSRGYLPQVVMLFCFTVLPLFIYYYRISRPVLNHDPRSAPAAQPR